MSASINNTVTTDAYPEAGAGCKIVLAGAVKVTIQVANAAVFMRPTFRDIDGTATNGAEVFLAPGVYSIVRPVTQIQFKSAVAGVPARVTAEALTGAEA